MSVARRTPSRIGIITLRSTTAIDCSSFSTSQRRAACIGRQARAALREANRRAPTSATIVVQTRRRIDFVIELIFLPPG